MLSVILQTVTHEFYHLSRPHSIHVTNSYKNDYRSVVAGLFDS